MKTILYNPIFINPQAYYVFPRLTRWLRPDDSYKEPANYIGQIEVTIIAYGEIGYTEYFEHTNYIDFTNFSNSYVRISLFTRLGACVLGEWKIGNMESDLPYIDPEVLASLKAVVIVGNKTNNDSDRAIVKNLVDPDNPFVISNAAYTEGSGYADKDSPYYGAFVTDGIDDLITSTKTVQEMLGGSNEITVVSMIHQVKDSANNVSFTNYIKGSANGYFRNIVNNYDKTGIYGYTSSDLMGLSVVNNILGDKNDYTSNGDNRDSIINGNFSVQGYSYNDGNNTGDFSSVAWYWTIIANKVLTTDQINQVIAYFNLDRTLNPDILCNTIKQGITNENHAEFGDKLIDYSGNGRDIQLNNIAWNKESGIDDDGALRLDGVNDFGKVTGMPIYKDYTFIIDREIISIGDTNGIVASKSEDSTDVNKQGAFLFEYLGSPNNVSAWSFYKDNGKVANTDFTRGISYQSKYSYNGIELLAGTAFDSDKLWLGTLRDKDSRFANVAIYSLMSFPYSMSEFLIERQLKKHKLGTLYPDMVEFRPVIKSNVLLDAKPTFVIRGTSTYLNAGDYVPENSQIRVSIKMNNIADRITKFTVNGKTIDIPENAYSEVTLQYGFPFVIDKSPQKISITIEQDENYVLFNPTINSNAIFEVGNEQNMTELIAKVRNHEIDGFIMYLSKLESKYILPNSWINKDTEVISSIYCLDNILQDDLHINIDGNSKYCLYADSSNNISEFLIMDDNVFEEQYITNVLTANTIDIQLDQYIRYEDIVQPYPVLLRFNDENGNEVSWGGKFRVGSTITRIGGIDDTESNLLNGLYSISGLSLNGKAVTSSTSIVEKQMVFKTTATYLLDNNEPNCILSPRLLRIPNSSYKILGHIPDISGHGNHGVIHNSAYAEGSGVNEDGSWQFDGVDDFINIPTLSSGGKQVLMKVNWQSDYDVPGYMYDSNAGEYRNYIAKGNKEQIAYGNASKTYIDGILNANLTSADLKDITHNITSQFNNASGIPYIGCRYSLENFLKMSLYDFMLFDNISTDDKIKELNEYVGIEGNTEWRKTE